MKLSPLAILAGLAVCVASAVPAHAAQGVLIVETTTSNGQSRSNQVQIEPQRMRTDVATGTGGTETTVIFDGPKQVMYTIDPARKSYSEMTKADIDAAGAQMAGAMAQMQQALEGLPPAQRAQMEAMMKGRGMPGMGTAPARTEYRKAGTSKVGKWTCDVYEGYQNNQKTGEVCTVAPQTLGFTAADFEVSRQLAAFLRGMIPQAADAVFQSGRLEEQGFSGVPVRRVTNVAGRQVVSELTEISRQNFPDSLFQVPEGFTRQASPLAPPRTPRGGPIPRGSTAPPGR